MSLEMREKGTVGPFLLFPFLPRLLVLVKSGGRGANSGVGLNTGEVLPSVVEVSDSLLAAGFALAVPDCLLFSFSGAAPEDESLSLEESDELPLGSGTLAALSSSEFESEPSELEPSELESSESESESEESDEEVSESESEEDSESEEGGAATFCFLA